MSIGRVLSAPLIGLIRVYQRVISPMRPATCRYYPSCSAYALQAIQQHGVIVGSVLAIRRIVRCHPWAAGGVDDVPPARKPRYRVTRFGFVVSTSQCGFISHGKA